LNESEEIFKKKKSNTDWALVKKMRDVEIDYSYIPPSYTSTVFLTG
jgi:hypothetical protein